MSNVLIVAAIILAWFIGLGTSCILGNIRGGVLRLSGSRHGLGWLWVLMGGKPHEASWRYGYWCRGKTTCCICGVGININTQVGVSHGLLTKAWCPKCRDKRRK